jgi:N6-L-threonylcarbamoyladenine synthase
LDFSFSGLKTSLRYRLEKMNPEEVAAQMPDLCASYQQAVIDALVRKTRSALERAAPAGGRFKSVGLSGGVANNGALRAALEHLALKAGVAFLAAAPRHTGDNAAMIAFAAWADPLVSPAPITGLQIEPGAELA